jgi:hypothetical protein
MSSHGASWNFVPLKVGRDDDGRPSAPAGHAHCVLSARPTCAPTPKGMARLGIEPDSLIGALVSECGFDPFERDDGMHPEGPGLRPRSAAYNDTCASKGYEGDNPWEEWANSGRGRRRQRAVGLVPEKRRPARAHARPDSETPYLTGAAIDFIDAAGDQPWCCHLSATSSRTGPTSCPNPMPACSARSTCCRHGVRGRARPASRLRRLQQHRVSRSLLARRGARAA